MKCRILGHRVAIVRDGHRAQRCSRDRHPGGWRRSLGRVVIWVAAVATCTASGIATYVLGHDTDTVAAIVAGAVSVVSTLAVVIDLASWQRRSRR